MNARAKNVTLASRVMRARTHTRTQEVRQKSLERRAFFKGQFSLVTLIAMVYALRKRGRREGAEPPTPGGAENREGKRQKVQFLHWREKASQQREEGGGGVSRARRDFDLFRAQARNQSPPRAPAGGIQGEEVFHVRDLRPGSGNYLKIRARDFEDLYFLVRRKSDTAASALQINECEFEIHCMLPPELENMTLNGFIEPLWDLFETLFDSFLGSPSFDEICFHVSHNELVGSISSAIYELKAENRNVIISELLSKLTGWNESSRPGVNSARTFDDSDCFGVGRSLGLPAV